MAPYSLNFEIVYWVLNPDYNIYMDIQQAINLQIYKHFDQEGIEFAYPTQSLFLRGPSEENDMSIKRQFLHREDDTHAAVEAHSC